MPREITMLMPRMVTEDDLMDSLQGVDPALRVRWTVDGAIIQVVDGDQQVALSMEQQSALGSPHEIWRLLPGHHVARSVADPEHRVSPDAQPVWIQAYAPWDEAGATGVRVCQALTDLIGGTCVPQDGRR
ncbi:hypothetical protein [Promicromonospora sp. NPDC023805]|uniref:hypothetical protein n=1 Tax=Promicromonospora sp. NPDC023805 TaxID=3154696 RepID=UPI0033FC911B